MNGVVAVVEWVHAQAHDVEGARGVLGRLDAALEVGHARGALALAGCGVAAALGRHGELEAGIGELVVGLTRLARGVLVGLLLLLELRGERVGLRAGLLRRGAVLLDVLAGLGGLLLRGFAALGHLRALRERASVLALQPAALGGGGGELRLQARDLALGLRVIVARALDGALERGHGRDGGVERLLQARGLLVKRADPALALERAGLARGDVAHMCAAVRQHAHPIGRDIRERRCLHVRLHGSAGIGHQPDVAEQRIQEGARGVRDAQARDERLAGDVVGGGRGGARGVERENRGAAFDARERGALGGDRRGGAGV